MAAHQALLFAIIVLWMMQALRTTAEYLAQDWSVPVPALDGPCLSLELDLGCVLALSG